MRILKLLQIFLKVYNMKKNPTKVVSCRIGGKLHSKRISLDKYCEIIKDAHFLNITYSEALKIHWASIVLNEKSGI